MSIKPGFLSELKIEEQDEGVWKLLQSLRYYSAILDREIEAPAGFLTDFASVPRVPVAYMLYGDKAHRESVLHDYIYATNKMSRLTADKIFLEAMKSRGKPLWIRWPMYMGVRLGGRKAWQAHRRAGHGA